MWKIVSHEADVCVRCDVCVSGWDIRVFLNFFPHSLARPIWGDRQIHIALNRFVPRSQLRKNSMSKFLVKPNLIKIQVWKHLTKGEHLTVQNSKIKPQNRLISCNMKVVWNLNQSKMKTWQWVQSTRTTLCSWWLPGFSWRKTFPVQMFLRKWSQPHFY